MIDTVDVVGQFCADSANRGHDPQFHKGGTVTVARREPQLRRLERDVAAARRFGFGDDDVRLLDAKTAADHLRVVDLRGATFTPHCAAVHPLRLVRRDRRGGVTRRCPHRRVRRRRRSRAAPADDDGGDDPRRRRRGRNGGLLDPAPRAPSPCAADLLDDDRIRTAERRAVEGDRSRRSADVHRGVSRRRVRPAHRRRAHRLRRPRCAVPLRVSGRGPLRHRPTGAIGAARRRRGDAAAAAAGVVSLPLGRTARRAARLASSCRLRQAHRHRQRRRLRRRRSGRGEPRRAHAGRPDLRSRHRDHPPPVGRAPVADMGAGTAALVGGAHGVSGRDPRRSGGGARPAPSPPPVPPSGPSSPPSSPVADPTSISTGRTVRICTKTSVESGTGAAVSGGGWGRGWWRGGGSCGSTRRRAPRRARASGRTASSTGRARGSPTRTGRRPIG